MLQDFNAQDGSKNEIAVIRYNAVDEWNAINKEDRWSPDRASNVPLWGQSPFAQYGFDF